VTASSGQTTVSWTAVTGATSYNIYWATSAGVTASSTKITGAVSPYSHTGRTNGTTYYYKVVAVNAGGESALSTEVSATPQVAIPGVPTGVTGSPGDGEVTISWSTVTGATTYNIYWATSTGVTTSSTKITGAVSPYTHTPLTNDTTYYYKVSAVNAGGESGLSAEVLGLPEAVPPSLPVADTGQSSCYNASSTQACGDTTNFPRQDADFVDIPNARSFTGPTQHTTYTSDYTTKDNVTGLIWKTCSEGVSGSTCLIGTAGTYTWDNAQTQCTSLNSLNSGAGYAGRTTWRLPAIEELYSLPNYGAFNPAIDTVKFPATVSGNYWSATTNANSTTNAWNVYFRYGDASPSYLKTNLYYVRCVCTGP
jgi:fibronectin type 3 domain-containing protein